jgi:hypothetical protein
MSLRIGRTTRRSIFVLLLLLLPLLASAAVAQEGQPIPFDSPRWSLAEARVVDHLGRKALAGTAFLKDAVFENGVVEFDVAVNGERSYPGVLFRIAAPGNWERVYLRPHHSNTARVPDVLQYVAAFNGIDSWQLYRGDGKTAYADLPPNEWLHVRLEVSGAQARVFLGGAAQPALLIHDLARGRSRGGLGLMGPQDGTAYFSAFGYRADDALRFEPPPPAWTGPGFVTSWEISQPFRAGQVAEDKPLAAQRLPAIAWASVTTESSGLLDVSRHSGRLGPGADCILARTTLRADSDETRKLRFGYSDALTVFLNGRPVFTGDSSYLSRDPSFPGFIGMYDQLYLPLHAGDNELLVYLYEGFGGWGLMFQDADAEFAAPGAKKRWQTPAEIPFAESAVFDAARNAFYVSAYDAANFDPKGRRQFIAKLTAGGRIDVLRWAEGLGNPTGLALAGDTLFVVEPANVVEIDAASGKLKTRHAVPGAVMLNKVARAADGALFVTDSRKGVVWRVADGKAEEWLTGLVRPNALHVRDGRLYVGTNGDGTVKAVDLATKEVRVMARLGQGILVGMGSDGKGNLLVSHVEGRLFRIAPDGGVTVVLDTSVPGKLLGNFAWIEKQHLLVAPTWSGNGVVAYELP